MFIGGVHDVHLWSLRQRLKWVHGVSMWGLRSEADQSCEKSSGNDPRATVELPLVLLHRHIVIIFY